MNRHEKIEAGAQPDNHRIVKAIHGRRKVERDAQFEFDMAEHIRGYLSTDQLREAFVRYSNGASHLDILMRRICFRALVRKLGSGLNLRSGVSVVHPETMEFGDGVHIGEQVIIQGRYDGRCVMGNGVWIGAQTFLDARDLFIGDYVGIGPGVKILGSEHTGLPVNLPIIQTDLEVAPVRIEAWADIGINAAILPGVTIGQGALVGAGAVVIRDVPEFCTVVGVPAQVIARRDPPEARDANARPANAVVVSPMTPTPFPVRGNS